MYSLSELLKELKISYKQLGKKKIDLFASVMPPLQADERSLIFFNKPDDKTLEYLQKGRYSTVLLDKNWAEEKEAEISRLEASIFLVDHPRWVVTRITAMLYADDDPCEAGIHPTAHVDPGAKIHPSVSIGPYCLIENCEIGEGSQIHAFTVIKKNTLIGKRVVIREFCFIGGVGFGFVRNREGILERMPHIGRVIIEDDVELFPYVNVDRATLGETRIKRGTKVDHYGHIGHNTLVGEDTIITAGVVMSGGSSVGDRCWLGVGSILKEKVSVADEVTTGLGTVVIHNVEKGTVVVGVPAKSLKGKK